MKGQVFSVSTLPAANRKAFPVGAIVVAIEGDTNFPWCVKMEDYHDDYTVNEYIGSNIQIFDYSLHELQDTGHMISEAKTPQDLHAKTCKELLEARVILNDFNTRDLPSVKITNSGRSVEFLAFFADSFGILDECLKDMYNSHLDEVSSVEEKLWLELKAHEAQQTIDNSVEEWED